MAMAQCAFDILYFFIFIMFAIGISTVLPGICAPVHSRTRVTFVMLLVIFVLSTLEGMGNILRILPDITMFILFYVIVWPSGVLNRVYQKHEVFFLRDFLHN